MKVILATLLFTLAPALAVPAPLAAPLPAAQQGPESWFPDVWNCRCHSQEKDLPIIQPLCSANGGNDMTIYPPAEPDPTLGRYVWCSKISTKSAQRENRLAGVFTDAKCEAEFGAGFKAECKVAGYTLCFGTGEECY